jgi:hypothetical protein
MLAFIPWLTGPPARVFPETMIYFLGSTRLALIQRIPSMLKTPFREWP